MLLGVFHPNDPFAVMTEKRVQAIVAESVKQKVELVFFNELGINLDFQKIDGTIFDGERWVQGTFPFPQAVMNVRPWGPRRRSDKELIFRKIVPFTAFLIDDKWEITKMVSSFPSLAPFIVPTAILSSVDQIDELLASHAKLVIKPVQGSRGVGVQALIYKESQYGLQQGADWIWLNREDMQDYVVNLKKDFMIQPYIVCLTPEGEPFDFRVLVQRNGEGNWQVTIIYPRIGAKDTITSNVSISGRTEELYSFLQRVFPDDHEFFPPVLTKIGLELAEFIDSHYAYPLNELGIDLAIDSQRRIWFYEANTCPGTLYHEQERAVEAVAYVKYIAENALQDEMLTPSNNFSFTTLGLLFRTAPSLQDMEAYALVAQAHHVQLVYFLLEDVRFRAGSISGFWREGTEWVARNFAFPDVVYNLMEQEDVDASHELYRSKSNMLLTAREPKGFVPSALFFAIASRHPLLAKHLPSSIRPENREEAKDFVDRHRFVMMKSDNAQELEDIIMIQRFPTRYVVRDGAYLHSFEEAEFLSFLDLFSESSYILIQQVDSRTHDGHSLHIRVYLFKQPGGSWETIHIAPHLALASSNPSDSLPFPVDWEWLVDREFSEELGTELEGKIQDIARTMAEQLGLANRNRIHELILDFAIDQNAEVRLLGGEFDGPAGAVHPYDIARRVIPYALSLLDFKYKRAARQ
ncbi:YheC/YheD family protein [Paenibacillus oryzisoli]|uniref:ATP-grasp domain-containing protein n=1 Tax=Paenibacillus oryzisoli TaxID=1850517 RepID=A0A198ALJ5_9BACL|nr:YheC/YheD family protein [Paenibacillus oryzisoli]OAS22107.1 hypothetical protein A8708_33580 [Paenibacillus oryzisoli]